LQAEGFPDWSRKDFKAFCTSLERHGRYDFRSISREVVEETGKELKEVQSYFVAFWTNFRRIHDYKKVLDKIERGERKILRLRQIRDAIQEKVERHLEETFGPQFADMKDGKAPSANELLEFSWPKMKINYGTGTKGRAYQEEEDAFLICMMHRHGYGAAERIRMEIRRAWQFRFDWYFKSRSAQEIQKRCDTIVKIVERENEELRKKDMETEASKAAESSPVAEQQPQQEQQQEPDVAAPPVAAAAAAPVAMDTAA
jgi:SWI/SNF-related matrix-associated actin-dependent regulator of chromatin subfamily A member 5